MVVKIKVIVEMLKPTKLLTAGEANAIVARSCAKASALGIACSVAVVDSTGHLVSFHRQDDAMVGSVALAIDKAHTAYIFNNRTEVLGQLAQPGAPLYGIQHTGGGRVVIFGGGIPLHGDGKIIGAIGVSGGLVEQDIAVAEAGMLDAIAS